MPGQKAPEAQRREQLLRATYVVALRDGFDAVTARAVAAEAGTSPGLVFFHFGSKDALLLELLSELLDRALDAEVTPEIAALPTARARLRAALQVELDGIPDQVAPVELVLSAWFSRDADVRRVIDAALARYRDVFVGLCRDVADEAGASAATAEVMATAVVSLVQGAAFQAVRQPTSFAADAFGAALDVLLPESQDGRTLAH